MKTEQETQEEYYTKITFESLKQSVIDNKIRTSTIIGLVYAIGFTYLIDYLVFKDSIYTAGAVNSILSMFFIYLWFRFKIRANKKEIVKLMGDNPNMEVSHFDYYQIFNKYKK